MPEMDGLKMLSQVKDISPDTVRIILSATRDIEQAIEAINMGEVFRFIAKPFQPDQFRKIIQDAVDFYRMKTEHDTLVRKIIKSNEELRSLTDALRVSQEKLGLITENAHDAMIMIDDDDTIVYWNSAATGTFGYSGKEVRGRKLHELITPADHGDKHVGALKTFRQTGTGDVLGRIREVTGRRKSGEEVPLELSISPVKTQGRWFAVGIARDISERVEARNAKERFQTMQRDLEAKIEKDLLQMEPPHDLTGAEIASLTIPSGHLDGDFIDFIRYDETHFDLLVGDVMGKGVQSALVGAGIKTFFLKATSVLGKCANSGFWAPENIDKVVAAVHDQCIDRLLDIELFSTLCFARFDLGKRTLDFVDCGHVKTIHYRQSEDRCMFLEGENLPLGMVRKADYSHEHVELQSGDVLLFYSDGLTETASCADELFGQDRLVDLVCTHHGLSPKELITTIETTIRDFSCKGGFDDDFSCVAMRFDFD